MVSVASSRLSLRVETTRVSAWSQSQNLFCSRVRSGGHNVSLCRSQMKMFGLGLSVGLVNLFSELLFSSDITGDSNEMQIIG